MDLSINFKNKKKKNKNLYSNPYQYVYTQKKIVFWVWVSSWVYIPKPKHKTQNSNPKPKYFHIQTKKFFNPKSKNLLKTQRKRTFGGFFGCICLLLSCFIWERGEKCKIKKIF